MNAWEIWNCDLGHGIHPVVIISHPLRVQNKPIVEVLDCSSQRATRTPGKHEVILDASDGMDWETLCKCDCIYAVPKEDILQRRGTVTPERRRLIINTLIKAHDWA